MLKKLFKDKTGRDWDCTVTGGTIRRVRALLEINLLSLVDTGAELLTKVYDDPVFAFDLLCAVLKPQIDAAGLVTQRVYDDLGRLTALTRYATPVTTALPQPLTAANFPTPAANAADSTIRYINDRLGRVQYTIDPAGYVTETRYDLAGRITDSIQYRNPVPAGSTNQAVVTALAAQSADAVTTHYGYDDLGHLTSETISAGDIPTRTNPTRTTPRATA